MNHISFNVLKEPWIPLVDLEGKQVELGILPCLLSAHEYSEIIDSTPITEFGMYRLLVAFVLDALVEAGRYPQDVYDLRDLLDEGRLDHTILDNYVNICGNVFELFDVNKPFLQTIMSNNEVESPARLFPSVPSGTNVAFWKHGRQEDLAIEAKVAVRWLTSVPPFMIAGGSGYSPSINATPPIYVMPVGKNLFETVIINIPLGESFKNGQNNSVAWRKTVPPGQQFAHVDILEGLTWRPRKIQLIPSLANINSLSVNTMKFANGDKSGFDWTDPNVAYEYSEKGRTSVRMKENRPLWRDAGPLLLLDNKQIGTGIGKRGSQRPNIVDVSFRISDDNPFVKVNLYGMRADKAKIFEWTKSAYSIPKKLGRNTRLGSLVHSEILLASDAANVLRGAIKMLYPREGEGSKTPFLTVGIRAERLFWTRSESAFYDLLAAFNSLPDDAVDDIDLIKHSRKNWREEIKKNIFELFNFASKDIDTDSDMLMRLVKAEKFLYKKLRRLIDEGN